MEGTSQGILMVIAGVVGIGYLADAVIKIKNLFSSKPKEEPVTAEKVKLHIGDACKCIMDKHDNQRTECRKEIYQKIDELDKSKASKDSLTDLQRTHETLNRTMTDMAIKQAGFDGKLDLILEKLTNNRGQ